MAKKKAGGGIDFKQLLLQKGERYGFYLAGGLLLLFLALGVTTALSSASSGSIVKNFDDGVKKVEQAIVQPGGQPPPPVDSVVYGSSTVPHIPFTEYAVRHELFNVIANEMTKRVNPRIRPPTEAQVDFVRGSVGVYDVIDEGGTRMIAVLKERQVALRSDPTRIRKRIKGAGQSRPPQAPPVVPPGGVPGGVPGGMPGGGGPTRGGRGGGFGGGMPGGLPGGMPPGGFGMQTARTTEMQVEYKKVDDPDIDAATFAETLAPERMVVVTCSIPYKEQLEEYRRALRARSVQELTELPEYRGFAVERMKCGPDGQPSAEGWQPLDLQAVLGDLFAKTVEFEPETPPATMDRDLQVYYQRILPPDESELLVPRPKLYRGEYPPINLPSVMAALKTLKEQNAATEVRTLTKTKLTDTNIFNRSTFGSQPGGVPGGAVPPGMPPGGIPGLPGGFRPPPGFRFSPPGAGGQPGQGQPTMAVAEDAWVMRFIDLIDEPGVTYRYRVRVKVANPNFGKPVKDLGTPGYAKDTELQSDWFEVPTLVRAPKEEYLYAAAKDERNRKVTEKMPPPGLWDDTWVQMQKWYDYIRPAEFPRGEPFGEWLVWDIKAVRGQYVGETAQVTLPIWSMVKDMFLFRDNPRTTRPASGVIAGSRPRSEPVWTVDLMPTPPVLLVDFEGGTGQYLGPKNRPQQDVAGVEMLFLTADGKLRVARSGQDLNDPDRQKREQGWKDWLQKVNVDTLQNKNAPGGGVPGAPGGGPGGGNRDS